jgi:hypothetical protein
VTEGFDALFDTFTHSAYRLESLPAYTVPYEDPSYQAWLSGTARPERSVRTSPWMRRIALTTAAGKRWSRTRVIDTPLTDYQRWQIPAYLESQAVGEMIRIVYRIDLHRSPSCDFWLFDDETEQPWAAMMNYSPSGEFLGYNVVRDQDSISVLRSRRAIVDATSISLAEFIALAWTHHG